MSIKEANSTITNAYSEYFFINEGMDSIINPYKIFKKFNKSNKNINHSKTVYEKKNKKINSFKNNKKIYSNKARQLTEDNTNNLKKNINYKELKQQIDLINKENRSRTLSFSINKHNYNHINNNFNTVKQSFASKIKKNFELNKISLYNINKYYSNKNINSNNKIKFSQSYTPKPKYQIKYNNIYNINDRQFSYSIKQNSSFINILLNEENEEDFMNINKFKGNKVLLNKLYSYASRKSFKSSYNKDYNITAKIIKGMKKSIEYKSKSCSKIHKNKILNKQNKYFKSDFIKYIDNSTTNYYIELNNDLKNNSNSISNYIGLPKEKNMRKKYNTNTILNSASNYIDSMKEERKTNKFIKELNAKNNKFCNSRFSYNKENYDDNEGFYNSPKSIRMNNRDNIILFHKANYEKNNNIKKKNIIKTHRNTWKKKSLKSLYENKNHLKDYQKSYVFKGNIIMPANNAY